jgi:group II intron reverse transcriptase/maturase
MMVGNGQQAPGPSGAKAASAGRELQEGNMTERQQTTREMSPGLLKVVERARRDPDARFNSLAHLLDVEALRRAFGHIRRNAAVGVDGVTKEAYAEDLESNVRALQARMKAKQYRHQPIRRVHIPKAPGKTRPIGISCIEDKIVQGALTEVLEAIFEQDFLDCSYGFRRGRSAHDALRALNHMVCHEKVGWILEADIQAFFDSLVRAELREMLRIRVVDGQLLRLVGKCLRVGVLDGEVFETPDEGTVQGSRLSPMLGNIYLHYVLDRWFEQEVRPRLRGYAGLIRYCDDFVIGFEHREDAERTLKVIGKRMGRYGLTLHPDKTRLIPFRRPRRGAPKGSSPETFDFLGFTIHWHRNPRGGWGFGMKTRKARVQRILKSLHEWCRRHRHLPRKEQHAALSRRLQGHYNYFGVNGNHRSLMKVRRKTHRIWLFWLRRRSQRGRRLSWNRFNAYLAQFPLPAPKIKVQIWARSP